MWSSWCLACLLSQKGLCTEHTGTVYSSCECRAGKPQERLHWEDLLGVTHLCLNRHTYRIEIIRVLWGLSWGNFCGYILSLEGGNLCYTSFLKKKDLWNGIDILGKDRLSSLFPYPHLDIFPSQRTVEKILISKFILY